MWITMITITINKCPVPRKLDISIPGINMSYPNKKVKPSSNENARQCKFSLVQLVETCDPVFKHSASWCTFFSLNLWWITSARDVKELPFSKNHKLCEVMAKFSKYLTNLYWIALTVENKCKTLQVDTSWCSNTNASQTCELAKLAPSYICLFIQLFWLCAMYTLYIYVNFFLY